MSHAAEQDNITEGGTVWRRAKNLRPGDIVELGVVVYDVLAVTHGEAITVAAIRERRRERTYRAMIFTPTTSVRLCDPMEGIVVGQTKLDFERRRLRDELEALDR